MKNLLVLAIASLFLIPFARTTLAAPAVQPPIKLTRVQFQGTLQSMETYGVDVQTMSVNAQGSGNSNQLGQFTIKYSGDVNLLDLSWSESGQFIGVNGDSLYVKGVGQATQNRTPTMFNLVEIYTVTGGTGRFNGASGTITLNRLFSITTGATSGTLEGYVLMR